MTKLDFNFMSKAAEADETRDRAAAAAVSVLEYMISNDRGKLQK